MFTTHCSFHHRCNTLLQNRQHHGHPKIARPLTMATPKANVKNPCTFTMASPPCTICNFYHFPWGLPEPAMQTPWTRPTRVKLTSWSRFQGSQGGQSHLGYGCWLLVVQNLNLTRVNFAEHPVMAGAAPLLVNQCRQASGQAAGKHCMIVSVW